MNINILLDLLKQGKNPSQISKELNISKQLINYYLRILKSKNLIKKIGYGTWEVKNYTLRIHKNKQIRGHAFVWKVKLNRKYNWLNLIKDYKLIRNKIPRIIINNKKIWLGKKSIIVYTHNSFYGINSFESKKYAVIDLLETLEKLEDKLKINLKPYIFKTTKEHYGMVKNELARQYNRNNEKLIIKDTLEGEWLWIDDSESLNELETKNPLRSKQVQDWWNDNKKHDFKVTASYVLEVMNGIQQNQLIFDKNMKSHLKILNKLGDAVDRLGFEIKKKDQSKTYLKESQTFLGDYYDTM